MTTTAEPTIVSFKRGGMPAAEGWTTVATMTVELGPFLIQGVRLMQREDGKLYVHPPKMRTRTERIVLLPRPGRDSLLQDATTMLRAFQARDAAPPLATAPDLSESEHEPPSRPA